MFEELLKEYCLLDPAHSLGNTMIDSACLNTPKVNFQFLPGLCGVSELLSCLNSHGCNEAKAAAKW